MELKNKSIMEKIINNLLNVLIFIFSGILLISLYNTIQIKLFHKDYSDFFGYSIFEVQTGSMAPEINPGDWIIVKSSNSIKLNDIVTYNKDGEYVTHRIISAYSSTYVTKGDANNSADEPIDKKQIVGVVVKILPNFGILKKTIFNPVVLIAIIITILICNFVFKKEKTNKQKNIEIVKNIFEKIKENNIKIVKKTTKNKIKKETNENSILELTNTMEQDNTALDEIVEETSSYIDVDASELDETFLEIAQNEMLEAEQQNNQLTKKEIKSEIDEIEIDEAPTKINLDLLENGRKSKNLIDKFISIKVEEINEIIDVFIDGEKTYVNEATIKNKLISSYVDAKYYNYFGNVDVSANKKQSLKINKYLEEVSSALKKKYKGSDSKYNIKVDKLLNIFYVITRLELAKEIITDKKVKEEFYKKELIKYAKISKWNLSKIKDKMQNIMKIQRNYIGIIEYLLKKFDTQMFCLEILKLKANKNFYAINLNHNITFSKVYSDYIIDKTYNEGVIAENKTLILLNLLSAEIIKDMLASEFNKKYVTYIPNTLYTKEKKLERLLNLIEDEKAKESIVFLINLDDLIRYKNLIKKIKKEGYIFAISIDYNTKIEEKNYNTMNIVDYIFVDKNIPNIVKTLSNLPEDLVSKLIYEKISEKIGDFGGE